MTKRTLLVFQMAVVTTALCCLSVGCHQSQSNSFVGGGGTDPNSSDGTHGSPSAASPGNDPSGLPVGTASASGSSSPSASPSPSPSASPSPSPSSGPKPSPSPSSPPSPSPSPSSSPTTQVNHHRFCGWTLANGNVTPDQDPGYLTFAANADSFDAVHPVWYHVTSATNLATVYGVDDPTITSHTTKAGQRTLLIPTIAAVDGSDPATASAIINDPTLKAQHVATIVNLAVSKAYDGVDLDYEHLPDGDRAAFSSFAADLATALHAKSKTLSFAVGGETHASSYWDYDALSAVADQLHIMAYDYHFLGSHPGPVSPLGWVQHVIDYAGSIAAGARKSKFILGLPNYGLAGPDSSVTSWYGPLRDSIALAGANYATTTDHMAVCPFVDVGPISAGRAPNAMTAQGHLFFDDLLSFEEKISAAQSSGLGGITYWTIGGEPDKPGTTSFFQMVRSHFPK